MDAVAPKSIGKLDMVIAFDTTGSMTSYIGAVRQEVAELIPRLFKDNEDLRLGIVAFGDYCDMENAQNFGNAYQCMPITNNENDLIKFVKESKDTSGGDGDEFYELVINKIVEETQWRDGSTRSILLIADAEPHELGYTYSDYVVGNQIDWRIEAKKAANLKIKIDTVTITDEPWYKELSRMTNGVSAPFKSGHKTAILGALENTANGYAVENHSKGCGGVMRVAPIGIFNAANRHIYNYTDTAHLAGWSAEITHKHIASTFASALLATTVMNCISDETVDQMQFLFIVMGGLVMMREYFPEHDDEWQEFDRLIRSALELGKSDVAEEDAIRELGEGWVGDEAIAIAIFSVMRHIDSFEDCIVCAVNHDGDSDSTGAIAGNIIGAILGYSAIPSYYLENLEIEPILVSAADDLCADVKIPEVNRRIGDRYIKHIPIGIDKDFLL